MEMESKNAYQSGLNHAELFHFVDIGPCRLYRADCFDVMRNGLVLEVDAVITDPPYASGGMYRGDRIQAPGSKYQKVNKGSERAEFKHDAKDQRSWMAWCHEWIALLPLKVGGYCLSFIDWRQLPALTDAFQRAGLIWRGICPWDKGPSARSPHKGYARHQAEYIVWGTNGPCRVATHGGPSPGVYRHGVLLADKHHMAGKPKPLLDELVQWVPPGATIFDPFMGSGTTGVACLGTGRRFIGCEIDPHYFQVACDRLQNEWNGMEHE